MLNSLPTACSLAKAFSKTADRRFNSDFVAVFKAVRHCFGHAVHPHRDAINSRIDHTLRQRIAREAHEMQGHSLHLGLSSLTINGHPDCIRIRIENSMKAERRFETNDSVKGCRASSDKDQFAQKWLEKASRLNEQFEIMF